MRRTRSFAAVVLIFLGLLCWSVTLFLLLRSGEVPISEESDLHEGAGQVSNDNKAAHSLVIPQPSAGKGSNGQDSSKLLIPLEESTEPIDRVSYVQLKGVDAAGHDLFVVRGADLSTLKTICSSLTTCMAFNSDGWMKGEVSEKTRSSLDLFIKHTSLMPLVHPLGKGRGLRVEGAVDEGAGIFASHMAEYSLMEKEFKIYVYESDVGLQYPSIIDYKYGVEELLIQLLRTSPFRTVDPEEANLFFLPSRCTAYRKSVSSLKLGIKKAAEVMNTMVLQVQQQYPFWNQSLGADHFYICAHDMGTEVVKLSIPELWKNSIGLVNTAEYSEPYFVPHKDISVPPHPGRGALDWSIVGCGGQNSDPLKRTKLAFLAGNANRGVRPAIYQLFHNDPDFYLVKGQLNDHEYFKALLSSKYCLCPRGNKGWSPRVLDALWFGCVPVFIADYYVPPLTGLLPWHHISISIPEKQVGSVKTILAGVSAERLADMQHHIAQLYHHLTWHLPPRPYDAFYGVIFQLWQRHQVHRTKTKS